MKLSHPIAIRFASLMTSGIIRGWLGTLDIRSVLADGTHPVNGPRSIYLFWHEMMLLPAYAYARLGFATLSGHHRDGELMAQVVQMLGGYSIRGSTNHGRRNRGGAGAVRKMLRPGPYRHICITPDGPRGPRRVVSIGAIYLASRGAMPIVPTGMAFDRPWRAGSWDRLALPRPFSRGRVVTAPPIHVPDGLAIEALEPWRQRAQDALDDLQPQADALAAGAPCDRPMLTPRQMWDARRT